MKILLLFAIPAVFFTGCAHIDRASSYFPPSSIPITKSVENAVSKVSKVTPYVKPEGAAALKDLSDSLFETQVELGKYVMQVDEQSRELAKAQNEVIYWHNKQISALKELWVWRLIAIGSILAVIGYLGLKTSWKFAL